jgi:tetratricopeptide (TPR) repeat protein
LRDRAGGGRDDFFPAESEMSAVKMRPLLFGVALIAGFAGVWRLQRGIDVQIGSMHQEQDELVLRSAPLLRLMSLEYAPLLADLYWTRTVQYYGSKNTRSEHQLDLLWPLLDITTTLDPNLIPAYRFGSTFLAEPAPRGAGMPEQAIEFLNRGIRENPDYWRLYEDMGFIYYFDMRDYEKASNAFLDGSKNPKALPWMKVLAARVSEKGESRETSVFLWNEIYNSTSDAQLKQNALTHLRLLRAQEDCEQLDTLVEEFGKRRGRRPASVRDLVNAGLIPGAPVDPLGFVYVIDVDGFAQLNPASPLAKDQPIYQRPM